jgi:hypothetical protein
VSRYEQILRDIAAEVRRIAAHAGIDTDEKTVRAIADQLGLGAQHTSVTGASASSARF